MKVIELSDFTQLGPSRASLSKRNFAVSTLSVEVPMNRWDDTFFLAWGDEVAVMDQGKLVMRGHVTVSKPDVSGAHYWSLEISDYWERLENSIAMGTFKGRISSRFIAGIKESDTAIPLTIPVEDVIAATLTGAASLLPCGWSIDLSGPGAEQDWMTVPFSASGDTHAAILQQCIDWTPDLVSYFNYDNEGELIITDKADDRLVILDPMVDDIESISLSPRHDLVPPVIGVLGLGSSDGYGTKVVAQYPEIVSLSEPYAMVATVDIPGNQETEEDSSGVPEPPVEGPGWRLAPKVTVRGRKVPIEDQDNMKSWWIKKFKSLSLDGADIKVGKSRLLASTPDMDTAQTPNYSAEAEIELVSGQINEQTKTIRWGERLVESYITCKNPPSFFKSYFPKKYKEAGEIWQGVLRCRIRTTNIQRKSYLLDESSTEIEDEEEEESSTVPEPPADIDGTDYENLCYSLYKATRRLPFQGTVVVSSKIDLNAVSGAAVSIVNDRPELATMSAIIQSADYDLITGKTTLTLGPPEHLGLQDIINRVARIQGQQDRTAQDTASNDERGPNPSGGSWWDWEQKPKRADFPSISPWYALETSSSSQPLDADFSVRLVYNDESEVEAIEVRRGIAYGPKNKMQVGTAEWTRFNVKEGQIYVNVTVDQKGKIASANFSTAPGGEWPAEPFVQGRTAYTKENFHIDEEHDGISGRYSYLVATVSGEKVTHHILSAISVSILPFQLVYEVRDFDWDPNTQGTQVNEPDETLAPGETESPETITPYSLIDTWSHDHVLLRKIAADPKTAPIQVWLPNQSEPIKIDARIKITKKDGVLRIGLETGTFVPTL